MKNWILNKPHGGASRWAVRVLALSFLLFPVVAFAQAAADADDQFDKGNFSEALTIYQELLDNDPRNLEHQLRCAECYVELEDVPGAIAQYNTALFYFAESDEAKLGLANALALDGRFDESLAVYDEIYLGEDSYIEAMVGRARTYWLAGDLEAAFNWIGEAIHFRPDHIGAQKLSQQLLGSGGGGPGSEATKEQLAEFAFNTGNMEEAKALYEELASEEQPSATTWLRIGKLREWNREWNGALTAYENLLAQDPENYDVLLRRAKLYWYAGLNYKALDAFQQLYSMPDIPSEFYDKGAASLAGVYRSVGDHASALVKYRDALKVDPKDHDIRSAYASTLAVLELYEEAISQARMVVDEDPLSAAGWLAMANTYSRMGKRMDALNMYCMIDPDSEYYAAAQIGLASTQLALWLRDDAIFTLEQLLARYPDNREAFEMLYGLTRTPDASLASDWRHSHDTDDNDFTGQSVQINIPTNADGGLIRFEYQDFLMDNTTRNEFSEGYSVGASVSAPLNDTVKLNLRGNQLEIDNGVDPDLSEFNWDVNLDFKLADHWTANVGLSDMVLFGTPHLARTGIRHRNAYVSTRVKIDTGIWVQMRYAKGELSDGNDRQEFNAKLQFTEQVDGQGRLDYGFQFHSLRFALDLNNGYWDPENYHHEELFANWTDTSKRRIKFDAAAFLGLNKDTGQSSRQTFRYNLGTRMELYNGKLVLRGGYISSDVATTTSSGPGYEYDSWYFGGNLEL